MFRKPPRKLGIFKLPYIGFNNMFQWSNSGWCGNVLESSICRKSLIFPMGTPKPHPWVHAVSLLWSTRIPSLVLARWERKKPWWHRWFNINHLIIHHQRDLSYLMFDIYLMVIWDLGYILQYVFKHEHLDNQRRFSSNSHSEWKANGFGVPKGTTMSYPNVRISGTTFVDNDNPFVFWGRRPSTSCFTRCSLGPPRYTYPILDPPSGPVGSGVLDPHKNYPFKSPWILGKVYPLLI